MPTDRAQERGRGTLIAWALLMCVAIILGVTGAILQHHHLLDWMPGWMLP